MHRKKRTDKVVGRFSAQTVKEAIQMFICGNYSIRKAATQTNIAFQTLSRCVKKYKLNPGTRLWPNYNN